MKNSNGRIKRVFVEEQSILNEIKFFDKLLRRKKPEVSPESDDDFAIRRDALSSTASEQIISAIISIPSGEKRLVMNLNKADANIYLSNDGNEHLVKTLVENDSMIGGIYDAFQITPPPGKNIKSQNPPMFVITQNTLLSGLPESPNFSVLLNIRLKIADYFLNRRLNNIEDAKKVLMRALDHKNLVAILDTKEINKLPEDIKNSNNVEDLLPHINMRTMVRAFTPSSVRNSAIIEWDKTQEVQKDKGPSDDEIKRNIHAFIISQLKELPGGIIPHNRIKQQQLFSKIYNFAIEYAQNKALGIDLLSDVIQNKLSGDIKDVLLTFIRGKLETQKLRDKVLIDENIKEISDNIQTKILDNRNKFKNNKDYAATVISEIKKQALSISDNNNNIARELIILAIDNLSLSEKNSNLLKNRFIKAQQDLIKDINLQTKKYIEQPDEQPDEQPVVKDSPKTLELPSRQVRGLLQQIQQAKEKLNLPPHELKTLAAHINQLADEM